METSNLGDFIAFVEKQNRGSCVLLLDYVGVLFKMQPKPFPCENMATPTRQQPR